MKNTIFLLAVILLTLSCRKFDKPGKMSEAGIVLTFDDDYVDNWYKYLPVLDSMNVKATFYVCRYYKLTPAEIHKLKIIEAHGNEIAFHTANHLNTLQYMKEHGYDQFLNLEINNELTKMRQDGFNPVSFAYPFGAHTSGTDNLLLHYFKSVRALNGTENYAKSLTKYDDGEVFYAMEMDINSKRKESVYDELLNSAKVHSNCLVLVGHKIEDGDTKMKVSLKRLKRIINKAKELNLRFYTVSEISRK